MRWVESCFPKDVMELMDFKLSKLCVDLKYENQIITLGKQDCLIKTIEVALSCTVNSPATRIDIKDVVSNLKNARDILTCSPKKEVTSSQEELRG